MWRANGNPNPCTREGFGASLTPAPWAWGAKNTFLRCSAGCK